MHCLPLNKDDHTKKWNRETSLLHFFFCLSPLSLSLLACRLTPQGGWDLYCCCCCCFFLMFLKYVRFAGTWAFLFLSLALLLNPSQLDKCYLCMYRGNNALCPLASSRLPLFFFFFSSRERERDMTYKEREAKRPRSFALLFAACLLANERLVKIDDE